MEEAVCFVVMWLLIGSALGHFEERVLGVWEAGVFV